MTLFTGWLDQPGIFLLLDKSRRPHRQDIIFLLEIKLRSSVFSIFGNCQSCILLIFLCAHCWNFVYLCSLCCEFQIVLSHIIAAICRQRNIWQWKICWPDKRMLQSTWTTSNTEEPTSAPTGWSTWTNQRWYSCRLSYTNLIILKQ